VPLASVLRGSAVESVHLGVVAVVAPGGRPVAGSGDASRPVVLRSTAKPFQALPLVLAGGIEVFGLDAADLALVCSSHAGTAAQVQRAAALLARAGLSAADLLCGVHRPLDAESAAALDRDGEAPSALHNNCSGKHAGMLLACRALGLPTEGYLDFDHPLQQRLEGEVAGACGLPKGETPRVLDGCSAPTFVVPLSGLATAYAALAAPRESGMDPERARALEKVAAAMAARPDMVAGPGRFTTALAAATGGRIVGKEGWEGVYGIAVRGPVAMGVALKIADGGDRARDTIVLELLRQVGALSGAETEELAPFYRPPVRNHRGLVVGEIVAELELAEAAS
jgi:L-asparaginase II